MRYSTLHFSRFQSGFGTRCSSPTPCGTMNLEAGIFLVGPCVFRLSKTSCIFMLVGSARMRRSVQHPRRVKDRLAAQTSQAEAMSSHPSTEMRIPVPCPNLSTRRDLHVQLPYRAWMVWVPLDHIGS